MKRLLTFAIVFTATVLLSSCGSGGNTPNPTPTLEPRVVKQVFATGAAPNDMVYANDSLYIANSLDNTVVRYALGGAELASFTFDTGASPAYLAVDANHLFVACNGENTLRRFDRDTLTEVPDSAIDLAAFTDAAPGSPNTGTTWGERFSFIGPGGITATGDKLLLTFGNIVSFAPTTYDQAWYGWEYYANPLTLPAGDPDAVSQILLYEPADSALTAFDGQFTGYDSLHDRGFFVCTGEVLFDADFIPHVDTDSFLVVHDFGGAESTLNLGRIGAGQIAVSPDGLSAYLGNGLDGNVYKVALPGAADTAEVTRGASNPIPLTTDFTFVSDLAFSPDGKLLFCASFNTDEVYVVDTQTDTVSPEGYDAPFDLSLDPQLLAGCANLEVVPNAVPDYSYSVYVLHGVANSVSRIDIP